MLILQLFFNRKTPRRGKVLQIDPTVCWGNSPTLPGQIPGCSRIFGNLLTWTCHARSVGDAQIVLRFEPHASSHPDLALGFTMTDE